MNYALKKDGEWVNGEPGCNGALGTDIILFDSPGDAVEFAELDFYASNVEVWKVPIDGEASFHFAIIRDQEVQA